MVRIDCDFHFLVRQTTNTSSDGTNTITEEHIKASLISAVEDKCRRRIHERVNQYQAEMETLNRTKQELNDGRAKINDIIAKLEREEVRPQYVDHREPGWTRTPSFCLSSFQNELKANIAVLKDKEQSLENSLNSLEKVDGIDVDEAVTTIAPLYKQWVHGPLHMLAHKKLIQSLSFPIWRLLNAYAEEAAIEDTIYYIGEALRNGVLDLEVFLKHVRQLSRKQFMLRALMQKCRQKAGLAGWMCGSAIFFLRHATAFQQLGTCVDAALYTIVYY